MACEWSFDPYSFWMDINIIDEKTSSTADIVENIIISERQLNSKTTHGQL